jgi:hypothetical protein
MRLLCIFQKAFLEPWICLFEQKQVRGQASPHFMFEPRLRPFSINWFGNARLSQNFLFYRAMPNRFPPRRCLMNGNRSGDGLFQMELLIAFALEASRMAVSEASLS